MLTELIPGVFTLKDHASWTGAHSRRTGYAVHLPQAGVLALIDPPPLPDEECIQLEALAPPTHVLLTCNWHLRGADAHRERWGCKILIHEAGLAVPETTFDGSFRTGDTLWDAVTVAQHITEFGWPEEAAFLLRTQSVLHPPHQALFVGDAVCGGRNDIGLPDGEVGQYTLFSRSPEQIQKLIPDLLKARAALERLLTLEFDVLAFGHGAPVLRDPHGAVRRFLGRDDVWGEVPRAPR
jgi:hypothetical protein